MSSIHFYRPVRTGIKKVKISNHIEPKSAVRLYCEQYNSSWNLQVRGLLQLANGRDGKDFIVASTGMEREDMVALRDAIDALLKEE